ncbi:UNVERIFIED_CONTAM: hypothetical protein GTU68_038334 [Idotea baltica]|nr:hypothetical protein [Idotea baltica]
MMDWTNRHCRYFHRLLSKNTLLYTEMVTTGAIIHGDAKRFLGFDQAEHPVALQLGGSSPKDLATCAKLAEDEGYDEVNLNCGCPSDRVQNGAFGACLMLEPDLVADCVKAMRDACDIPVSIKCRIGVDDQDDYEGLQTFTRKMVDADCDSLTVHARKAWLKGLSPKQNREIPPLDYSRVYQLKQDFPDLEIVLNGGIESLVQTKAHLQQLDGVMMGRAAYQNPWILATVDEELFGSTATVSSRLEVIERLIPYIENEIENGARLSSICRHILGLFQGVPGAKRFKRILSEQGQGTDVGIEVLKEAVAHFDRSEELTIS